MHRRLCEVYRSAHKDEMYLYVDKRQGLAAVPDELLKRFGKPQLVMAMLIGAERRLARAAATDVLAAIAAKGYCLQLPPVKEEYLLDLYRTPTEARY